MGIVYIKKVSEGNKSATEVASLGEAEGLGRESVWGLDGDNLAYAFLSFNHMNAISDLKNKLFWNYCI